MASIDTNLYVLFVSLLLLTPLLFFFVINIQGRGRASLSGVVELVKWRGGGVVEGEEERWQWWRRSRAVAVNKERSIGGMEQSGGLEEWSGAED